VSERDDDNTEFDFFEEPETREAAAQERAERRAPRGRPPGAPLRPAGGLTPLLRLVGLIAFAILVVVLLVLWVQGCQDDKKRNSYRDYLGDVAAVAKDSETVGRGLNDLLTTPGLKQSELQTKLNGLVEQQELGVAQAQKLDPPGPLRPAHRSLVEALQFRVSGLQGLARAFEQTKGSSDANAAGALLAAQAQRLVAGDVIWDDLFKESAVAELKRQKISGIEVPDSNFVQTVDLASNRSMVPIWQRIQGASIGGKPTGLHGTGIAYVKVLPAGVQLSTTAENTVEASTDLTFVVGVQDTGDNQEVKLVVTLTIKQSPTPIVKKATIDLINPGETKTVSFADFPQVQFGEKLSLLVSVDPVPGEKNTSNNSAEYPVIFSLG